MGYWFFGGVFCVTKYSIHRIKNSPNITEAKSEYWNISKRNTENISVELLAEDLLIFSRSSIDIAANLSRVLKGNTMFSGNKQTRVSHLLSGITAVVRF